MEWTTLDDLLEEAIQTSQDDERLQEAEQQLKHVIEICRTERIELDTERMTKHIGPAYQSQVLRSAYNAMGIVYRKQERYEEATDIYTRLISKLKENPSEFEGELSRAYNNLGNVQMDSGKYDDAVNSYSEVVKIRGARFSNISEKALAWYNFGDLNECHNYVHNLQSLARAQWSSGNSDKAEESFLEALRILAALTHNAKYALCHYATTISDMEELSEAFFEIAGFMHDNGKKEEYKKFLRKAVETLDEIEETKSLPVQYGYFVEDACPGEPYIRTEDFDDDEDREENDEN